MHALLAHAYHAIRFALHVATHPLFRPLIAAGLAAGLVRLLRPEQSVLAAGLAMLAGWAALNVDAIFTWPPTPLGRLTGAALLLLGATFLETSHRPWLVRLGLAIALSWWLRGAPISGAGISHCVPVFFGALAGMALAERLARAGPGDPGWTRAGGALALAGALWVTGASTHWALAAMVPAVAALALLGLRAPSALIARAVTVVATAAVLASDRGRLVPIDAAAAAPLAAWFFAPRLTRLGPAGASLLAVAACVALSWGAAGVWAQR
jgi:hypothetical protein